MMMISSWASLMKRQQCLFCWLFFKKMSLLTHSQIIQATKVGIIIVGLFAGGTSYEGRPSINCQQIFMDIPISRLANER